MRNLIFLSVISILLTLIPSLAQSRLVEYELVVSKGQIEVGEKIFKDKFLINGSIPAPELVFNYGDIARIRVVNTTNEETLIHWHGIILPNEMDGVPYVNSLPIAPHSEKVYEFPIKQTGTYWYHSHVMFQEEDGMYGALKLLPKDTKVTHTESTIVLADLAHEKGSEIQRNLKKDGEYYDLFKSSVQSWLKAFQTGTAITKWRNSLQRMGGMDYADVAYDFFTANGKPKIEIFSDGDLPSKVRLRLINGSATSIFKVTYAGGPMTVVAADGLPVEPVKVNVLPISVAETYDVIVETNSDKRLELRSTSLDNSGYSSVLIGPKEKTIVSAPNMPWKQPIGITMGEMMGMPKMSFWKELVMSYKNEFRDIPTDIQYDFSKEYSLPTESTLMPMMDHSNMKKTTKNKKKHSRHAKKNRHEKIPTTQLEITQAHLKFDKDISQLKMSNHKIEPDAGNKFRIMNQTPEAIQGNFLGDQEGVSHFNELTYGALRAKVPIDTETSKPLRTVHFTLNGNMENYIWTINGRPVGPETYIKINKGERVRFVMKNTTMMNHPMHLHGHFFRVMTNQGKWSALKHTVNVAPLSTTVFEFAASEEKDWFFHCHILYHMMDGMTRIVRYEDKPGPVTLTKKRKDSKEFNFTDSFFFRSKLLGQSNYSRTEGKFFNSFYQFEYDILGNYEGDYEGEIHAARTLTRFLSLYVGGKTEKENNMSSELSPTLGLTWVLPLNIEVDLKYQPLFDEDVFEIEFENAIQLTDRLQMNFEYSSTRKFYAELEWRHTKHFSLTTNYNRSFETLGVGVGYTY